MPEDTRETSSLYKIQDGEEPLSILKSKDDEAKPGSGQLYEAQESFRARPSSKAAEEAPISLGTLRPSGDRPADDGKFLPLRPQTLEAAGIASEELEKLILKLLHTRGAMTGRSMAIRLGLPYRLIEPDLLKLKNQMLVSYRGTAAMGDYEYEMSGSGGERARRYMNISAYADTAPVPLPEYVASVAAQSPTQQGIRIRELEAAFTDLMFDPHMLDRLGPAINSGRGLFLYGSPGNGKTSISERITNCFGSGIWIPRAITVDGEIIRLFDPVLHEALEDPTQAAGSVEPIEDLRWIKIQRPTVIIGGELTMDQLEMRHNSETNVSEAPLQMKSNCGAFVIDDFGRQRMPTSDLLNRWIVPLEKRYDFQSLASGKKIQVPFDQLIVFSTNLEPRDLVDEAFLRRIPYKIEVTDPEEDIFRKIFRMVGPQLGFKVEEPMIDWVLETHYHKVDREMRACHPRDLCLQARSWCLYHEKPMELTKENLNFAVENYFTVM